MKLTVTPAKRLAGEIRIPGDKSISHRAIMLGSIAKGDTHISHFLMSDDCLSTIRAFRQMGVPIEITNPETVIVKGQGLHGLKAPNSAIDAGNSGTTARLLAGLLAGQSFNSIITGDDSLRKRPMDRVIIPLRQMGANITGTQDKYLPLSIRGSALKGINYHMPVASAQVKSCLILATLYADTPSRIFEPALSRNHTELMLQAFGGRLDIYNNEIIAYPANQLYGQHVHVPGDISSAAFFITAGLLVPNSTLVLKGVGLNPTRTGILDVYKEMGGDIAIENTSTSGGEPMGDIIVKTSNLEGTVIGGQLIPRLIDEIPVIALAATQAQGTTIIKDAQELKVKESNRIATVVDILSRLGADIEATDDGMVIHGPTPLKGNQVDSFGDHRLAMMAAIAGLIAQGETTINSWECVNISFPGFYDVLSSLQK
ncbi:3-phosphoshikimate 1-carboxyvinyltransferase [Caldicoprobacter guelmensis]|uniref:3-phosphoshikimate 1-carboxyvinyltransferase n=1 Tax=Caldicoprobacter guelmensis TaxID=1170224 RepID=UPI00195B8274|nr:3-phosphoshikimate 1-carboxyvinyltransferase [Caldicoprobacter guelmensis]MBM7581697.1 3-phosphoshikimate 1-carboxyvinyltransferase [Caldicoprobacter guelmensis]